MVMVMQKTEMYSQSSDLWTQSQTNKPWYCDATILGMNPEPEVFPADVQMTPEGLEIPVPTNDKFLGDLKKADLTCASQAYAVANTPIYLIRRLQEDPAVYEIAKFSGEDILQALRNAVRVQPESLLDYTRPYVYLVALSKLPSEDFLRSVDTDGMENWRWLPYMKQVLLETYLPLSTGTVLGELARLAPAYSELTRSDATLDSPPTLVLTD